MANHKPILIEDGPLPVDAGAVIADVVDQSVDSVGTHDGKLISRRDFARTPVPKGMRVKYSPINKAADCSTLHPLQLSSPGSARGGSANSRDHHLHEHG